MKRYSTVLLAMLMLAFGLSTASASGRVKSNLAEPAFVLILGIGY